MFVGYDLRFDVRECGFVRRMLGVFVIVRLEVGRGRFVVYFL